MTWAAASTFRLPDMSTLNNLPTDDVEEKARRNFIAISAAIVLAWWLRLEVPFLANFIGLASDEQSRFRVWVAAIPILLYFGLRYHFSTQRAEAWQAWLQDHFRRLYRRYKAIIAKQIHAAESAIYDQRKNRDLKPLEPFAFVPSDYSVQIEATSWMNVDCTWRRSDDDSIEFQRRFPHAPEDAERYTLDACDWVRAAGATSLGSLFFSRGSLEVFVPYTLGIAALVGCMAMTGVVSRAGL